ncbi:MAG: hypothetical protein ACRD5E_11030 [Nitrososphaeraceae archaeon]
MSDAGKPITSQELTAMTKTSERNIREWLANQTAALGAQAGESKIGEVVKAGGFKKFRRTALFSPSPSVSISSSALSCKPIRYWRSSFDKRSDFDAAASLTERSSVIS